MNLWRVAFDNEGNIVSCDAVREGFDDTGCIIYVTEESETLARIAAIREYNRKRMRDRREKLREKGLCRCGREPRPGKKTCATCAELSDKDRQNVKARKEGKPVPRVSKAEAFARRRQEIEEAAVKAATPKEMRKAVLLEVHKAWMHSRNNGMFTEWLAREIKKVEC